VRSGPPQILSLTALASTIGIRPSWELGEKVGAYVAQNCMQPLKVAGK
jgi:hypothetical protein